MTNYDELSTKELCNLADEMNSAWYASLCEDEGINDEEFRQELIRFLELCSL